MLAAFTLYFKHQLSSCLGVTIVLRNIDICFSVSGVLSQWSASIQVLTLAEAGDRASVSGFQHFAAGR